MEAVDPGDSLSPPDISPVRPLIRQQAGLGPGLTCGLQCLGGGLPRHPSPGRSALANSNVRDRAARLSAPAGQTERRRTRPSREPSSALSTVVENTSFN